ncbi:MAG: AbrB/MazE/SpoVT family DNA-binding domain-containing protein [Gammaproteobacteria bacterium]|nr:AbrB/MazE/SpoVT family DNA-binding domain-containing protein [Gammaproteobacteria bacterium]MBV8307731.1 AbrB/MazE/SpoVT family DNA-binding domain-containing protein [Gammaproteobacteria bacterium]
MSNRTRFADVGGGAGGYTYADKDGHRRAAAMPTKITANGQITVPRRVREMLHLEPGDRVDFQLTDRGEVVLRRITASPPGREAHGERMSPRREAQMQARAEELLQLLRGLD